MKTISFEEYINNYANYLADPNPTIVGVVSNDICILSAKGKHNEDYCESHNIKVHYTGHRGGCIVNFKNDISVGLINTNITVDYLVDVFVNYFRQMGLDSYYDGNDIMVNNHKVIGISRKEIEGKISIALHVSIDMDLGLIENICIKPMNKVPKGLSDFGVTREDIIELINTKIINKL